MTLSLNLNGTPLEVEYDFSSYDDGDLVDMQVYASDSEVELTGILTEDLLSQIEMRVREHAERLKG